LLNFSLLDGYIPAKYLWYINNAEFSFGETEGRVTSGIGVFMAHLLAFLFMSQHNLWVKNKIVYVFYISFIFSQVMINLFPAAEMVGRTLLYLVFFKTILLPYLFLTTKERYVNLTCTIFLVFEVLVFIKLAPIQGLIS
jgi:hypothetical protein